MGEGVSPAQFLVSVASLLDVKVTHDEVTQWLLAQGNPDPSTPEGRTELVQKFLADRHHARQVMPSAEVRDRESEELHMPFLQRDRRRSQLEREKGQVTAVEPVVRTDESIWAYLKYLTSHLQFTIPILHWLPKVTISQWRMDAMAGLSSALNQVPKSLAYAFVGGLPSYVGVYSCVFPPLIYALFGSSHHLGVGPSAIISLLIGAVAQDWCKTWQPLGPNISPDEQWYGNCDVDSYVYIVRKLTFLIGLILLVAGLLHGEFLIRFFSRPLMTGFLFGTALITIVSQLKFIFYNKGVKVEDNRSMLVVLWDFGKNLDHTHWPTVVFALSLALFTFGLKKWKRTKLFYGLILVIVSTLVCYGATKLFPESKFYITGYIEPGLPAPNAGMLIMPHSEGGEPKEFPTWMLNAGAIGLIGFLESAATAELWALKHGYFVNIDQELVAVGISNVIGAMFTCMPTMGAISSTAMLSAFGSETGLGNAICAIACGLFAMVATSLFRYLPKAALALIVDITVLGLIDVHELKFLYKAHKRDFLVVFICLAVTVAAGIDIGMQIAILVNLLSFIHRSTMTESHELGRVPGTTRYIALEGATEPLLTYPGVVIVRFHGALFFGNASSFKQQLFAYLETPQLISKGIIVDCGRITFIDASGAHAISDVVRQYRDKGLVLLLRGFNLECTTKIEKGNPFLDGALRQEQVYGSVDKALSDILEGKVLGTPVVHGELEIDEYTTLRPRKEVAMEDLTSEKGENFPVHHEFSCIPRCCRRRFLAHSGGENEPLYLSPVESDV